MMMTSYLLDRPGYMNDPVPETYKNVLIAAHCTSGTRLDGFDKPPAPYILRDHSESSLGVSTQVLWPEGQPATLVRFTGPNEMIIDTGTVVGNVDTPPAGGCRTSVELRMDNIEDCRDVKGFHQVVDAGQSPPDPGAVLRAVRHQARAFAAAVDVSPRETPHEDHSHHPGAGADRCSAAA